MCEWMGGGSVSNCLLSILEQIFLKILGVFELLKAKFLAELSQNKDLNTIQALFTGCGYLRENISCVSGWGVVVWWSIELF